MLAYLRHSGAPASWRVYAAYHPNPRPAGLSLVRYARSLVSSDSFNLGTRKSVLRSPETAKGAPDSQTEGTLPRRNILEQSKVQEYLDYVAATNSSITLDDIERYRPHAHAQVGGKQYEGDYATLLATLVRSFSAKQLQKFVELYGLNPPAKRTKWNYAASIIEDKWHWPSLTNFQKQQKDRTEVSHEVFPLDASQSFLLLGKDGADLLTLSRKYNVHISLSANPLCLKVEGLRGSLDKLGQHINNLNDGIKTELFTLPNESRLKTDILQRISRLSGVFTESIDGKIVRISHRRADHNALAIAKRLLIRASCENIAQIPLCFSAPSEHQSPTHNSPSHNTYSMYPFLPPQSLPWTTSAGPVFRIRRVGEWLKFGSADNNGNLIPWNKHDVFQLNGGRTNIRSILLDYLNTSRHPIDAKALVSASLGHLLFCSPHSQTGTLSPPLREVSEMSRICGWIQDRSDLRVHSPSLPTTLLRPKLAQERVLHRLAYSSLKAPRAHSDPTTQMLKFEIPLNDPLPSSSFTEATQSLKSTNCASLSVGSMAYLDLMLPDRPLDMRISVFKYLNATRDQWPAALDIYQTELRQFLLSAEQNVPQPSIPLSFSHGGSDYYLQSTCNVRQDAEATPGLPTSSPSKIIRESILDLETSQRSATCQVICDNVEADQSWTDFLTICDRLTTVQ